MKPEILVLSGKLLAFLRKQPIDKTWKPADLPVDGITDVHANGGPTVMIEFLGDKENKEACSLEHFMLVNDIKVDDLN